MNTLGVVEGVPPSDLWTLKIDYKGCFLDRRLSNSHDGVSKHSGDKKEWKYPLKVNSKILKKNKKVALVESIGDMLALWENGIMNSIVTFGLSVSPRIRSLLLNSGVSDIFISFNNDMDGNEAGNLAANKAKQELQKIIDPKKIKIALPESANDFGEMKNEDLEYWRMKNEIHI